MRLRFFRDRLDAGRQLAAELEKYKGQGAIVLGVPRGGVAVGYPIVEHLDAELDIIIPRKLPIPFSPEAGFGAITEDGTIILNELLVAHCRLSPEDIDQIAREVLAEVQRRVAEYRSQRPRPILKDRTVILVDDGLATGYTMIAAIHSVKKQKPAQIVLAVPCSPASTLERIRTMVDETVCLAAPETESFAVANFYQDFHDMSDAEVKELLARRQLKDSA
jgi:putative phosphoribosyl transferase